MARDINSLTQRYDSETDPAADPDTDATGDSLEQGLPAVPIQAPNKMQHSLHGGGIGPRSSQQHSSFKRPTPTPVMGNRGLETRQSKRSQQHPQLPPTQSHPGNGMATNAHPITVGALEVMNVKQVVNRYGTLPKVARIGAYLDSLEDSNAGCEAAPGSPGPVPPPPANGHSTPPGARLNPKMNNPIPPQQMIRSNSSGGVTMQNNAAASLNKLQRHRTTTEGTMMTFSSFRAAGSSSSPKRSGSGVGAGVQQPALANLEFPPPPLDLPPPPEEFEAAPPPPPPAPESAVQAIQQHLHAQNIANNGNIGNGMGNNNNDSSHNDVSNTAPSVEEASSRFGVSLRKREPSTDSCSSLGSPPEDLKEKLITEIKAAGKESAPPAHLANGSSSAPVDPVSLLVTELAESMNLPKKNLTNGNGSASGAGPATPGGFKAQLKKVEPKKMSPPMAKAEPSHNIIDFKAHLRRVEKDKEPSLATTAPTGNNANCNSTGTLNRKDDSNKKFVQAMQKTEIKIDVTNSNVEADTGTDKAGGTAAAAGAGAVGDSDLGKRRSTGSINSLKKLWEQQPPAPDYASSSIIQQQSSAVNGGCATATGSGISSLSNTQLSPKYGMKAGTLPAKPGNKPPPAAPPPPPPQCTTSNPSTTISSTTTTTTSSRDCTSGRQQAGATIKTSHSTQLFTDNEEHQQHQEGFGGGGGGNGPADMTQSLYEQKPNIPQIQQKPAVPHKPTKLTIYATPIAKLSEPASSTQISRESILELVGLLEGSLKHPVNAITGSQWLQLSDKLNILQNSCVIFAENGAMPPHSKFQFRELVTRVEAQSQHLRSAGSKNVQDNERLVAEVGQSLRQISNALNR